MSNDAIERRIDSLSDKVSHMQARLDELDARLADFDSPPAHASGVTALPSVTPEAEPIRRGPEIDSDNIWSWVGSSSLLPRIATVCFILVFALILRTMTDNGFVGMKFGSYLGMAYAASLVAVGWRLLAKKSRLAPVFPVCGTLLMYSITLETHARFESVSAPVVYAILLVMLVVITVVSLRFKMTGLNTLGIFGTCLVAAMIDFPRPEFLPLVFLFLAANILAYISAYRLPGCEWNRWAVFILTGLVWLLWAFKLKVPLATGQVPAPYMSHAWYLPALFVFSAAFIIMTVGRAINGKDMRVFDLALPTLNALWSYPVALIVIEAGSVHTNWLGIVGVLLAAFHFGFAAFLFKGDSFGGPAICGFTFAGGAFLVLAFPAAVGSVLLALPVWSVVAVGLARMSEACEIGGVRLTSYILQTLACVVGVVAGCFALDTPMPNAAILIAGVISALSAFQFQWCRRNPLACNVGFFASFDRSDRSGIVLLAASLISGYYMLQLVAYLALAGMTAEPFNTFTGAQSILINVGAIGLLVYAMMKKNKEILSTAVLVIIIGALKVFGYDLFKSHGVPLVLSVFSFGAVAAVGSVVMSKWSDNDHPLVSG